MQTAAIINAVRDAEHPQSPRILVTHSLFHHLGMWLRARRALRPRRSHDVILLPYRSPRTNSVFVMLVESDVRSGCRGILP